MKKQTVRSDVQRTLIEMRRLLGYSQQALAVAMGKALVTIARWETTAPPRGNTLLELRKFAEDHQMPEIAARFQVALFKEVDFDEQLGEIPGAREVLIPLGELMMNRHLPAVANTCAEIFKLISRGYGEMAASQRAGAEIKCSLDRTTLESLTKLAASGQIPTNHQVFKMLKETYAGRISRDEVGFKMAELESYIAAQGFAAMATPAPEKGKKSHVKTRAR
jgi:transcriptional regulator with XRE-family HTH domain